MSIDNRTPISRVVVVHDAPQDFRAAFEEKFPAIQFAWVAEENERAAGIIADADPQAVFTIVRSTFRGPSHHGAAHHKSVEWVHCGGSGYEHLLPLDPGKVVLTNCVGVLAPFLAETVMGGMLALNCQLIRYHHLQAKREWVPLSFRPLQEQTLVILGLGAVGQAVARYAKALGMRVIATMRKPDPALESLVDELHPHEDFRKLLGRADVLSVHWRHTSQTEGLIDRAVLEALPKDAIFINTARGKIVKEKDLVAVLESGHLGGAFLDVFEKEPLPKSSPLWAIERVLISPHTANSAINWPTRFAWVFADNLERWNSGRPLLNEVAL